MKRERTSMLLFLGAWLAALVAGYTASRGSVFAAGAQNCAACGDCTMMDTWWDTQVLPPLTGYSGMVDDETNTPDITALLGKNERPGGVDIFAIDCYDYGSFENPPKTLQGVTYTNATLECNAVLPPQPGLYQATKGQGMTPSGVTATQMLCVGAA